MDQKKMSKNIAFIFARGGSKGIKRKNVKHLNGIPLILYTLEIAKKSNLFDHIFVSTDDQEIANLAINSGIKLIKRPKSLATDISPEFKSWKHAVKYLDQNKIKSKKIVILPVTSPLRNISDIERAITKLNNKTDMVISINETDHSPYFNMVKINKNGLAEIAIQDSKIERRQDSPKIYNMTTVVYATTASYIRKSDSIFEGKVRAIKIPVERAMDIDSNHDFYITELLIKDKKI